MRFKGLIDRGFPCLGPARTPFAAAGFLIFVFLLQSFSASLLKSPTFDEPAHIAAGLSYLETHSFARNPQHPPLMKELAAIPLTLAGVHWPGKPDGTLPRGMTNEWDAGFSIITSGGPDRVMFWARLPMILIAALLGLVLFLWARELAGNAAAFGTLFLYALSPTMVAHSYLVTMDAGVAAFTVLLFFLIWKYLRYPSTKRLLLCGLAMGAALAAKFSAIFMVAPAAFLVFAALRWAPRDYRTAGGFFDPFARPQAAAVTAYSGSRKKSRKDRRSGAEERKTAEVPARASGARGAMVCLRAFVAMCAVAFVVVQALYFFPGGLSLYLAGILRVNADHDPTYLVYMAGEVQKRFASYFAVAYLLKETLPSILLAALGLVVSLRSRKLATLDKLFLVLPPAVWFAMHTLAAANLGIRYILPVLPFAYMLGGLGLAALVENAPAWKRAAAAVLCAWSLVAAAGIYPDHLSYFNELACLPGHAPGIDGGSRWGPLWLDDHNVDWGQGLKQLRAWRDRFAGGRKLRIAYYGSLPPAAYGLGDEVVPAETILRRPPPGLYAVSAHFVGRLPALAERLRWRGTDWLRDTQPVAIVGHAFYIFDLR